MWDNCDPQRINLDSTFEWIRSKFKLTMCIQGVDFIVEGIEYKLFENLCMNKESNILLLLHIDFNNILIGEFPESTHFLRKES